jgi:hypothetical protein
MEDWIKLVLTGDPRIVAGLVVGGLAGLGTGITVGKVVGNWALSRRLADAEKQLKALRSSLDDSVYL